MTVAKNIKKGAFDFQGLHSLPSFPHKTPFKSAVTHTHLQTVKKYKQKNRKLTPKPHKVLFLHEFGSYRQLPFPQIYGKHHRKVVGTLHNEFPKNAIAA